MIRRLFLYFVVLSIPAFLGISVWQSVRYNQLESETKRLEKAQETWIESNKRLIVGISVLSSSERIENIAKTELGLTKKRPEEVLQIRLEGGRLDG